MTEKMKIAQFEEMTYGSIVWGDESWEDFDSYVRLSEYIEVKLIPRDETELIEAKVAILEKAEVEAHTVYLRKKETIDKKILALRGITFQPSGEATIEGKSEEIPF